MWPFEALPTFLQVIGYIFPFALPTAAFRNIMIKDANVDEPTVYLAFLTLTSWIAVELVLCFWLISEKNHRKRKENDCSTSDEPCDEHQVLSKL